MILTALPTSFRRILVATLVLLCAGALVVARPSRADGLDGAERAARAAELIDGLDLDDARKELAASGDEPVLVLERGRLALYEGACDEATALLSRPDVARTQEGESLLDIAKGCARVIAATVLDRDEARAVEIRYQDENDRPLTPLLVETAVRARQALTRDLGVTWPRPTRIVVVRDLLSLSAMTGLPYEAAQTTGTVAVAKWGRVTLLSPRATRHGFAWRDTLVHELTHLAVTRATVDRAPLWLQEGVAKREEIRWREPSPFDDRPSPDGLALRGMELGIDLALDRLGPSIAMLSSADQALVAFAEVTSFVRYFATASVSTAELDGGAGASASTAVGGVAVVDGGSLPPAEVEENVRLPALLRALREHRTPDQALVQVSGLDLRAWDKKWRAALLLRPKEPLSPLYGLGPATTQKEALELRDLRERGRLAELLFGREHADAALLELDGAPGAKGSGAGPAAGAEDANLRYLRGRVLEALKRSDAAAAALGGPRDVVTSYAPWWALRGRLVASGLPVDPPAGPFITAAASFQEGVAADPYDVEAACEVAPVPTSSPSPPPARSPADPALCEAARRVGEPDVGRD